MARIRTRVIDVTGAKTAEEHVRLKKLFRKSARRSVRAVKLLEGCAKDITGAKRPSPR